MRKKGKCNEKEQEETKRMKNQRTKGFHKLQQALGNLSEFVLTVKNIRRKAKKRRRKRNIFKIQPANIVKYLSIKYSERNP